LGVLHQYQTARLDNVVTDVHIAITNQTAEQWLDEFRQLWSNVFGSSDPFPGLHSPRWQELGFQVHFYRSLPSLA